MANQRVLDVWLVDLNEVYSAVPFTVVADWLQQGRLLPTDRVRLAGNRKWHTLDAVPAFAPYLPRHDPLEVEDKAEALGSIDLGLEWPRVQEEEDDDVDMIPLIDISLVLLIFFMMTATVASEVFAPIQTPGARHQLDAIANDQYWIGIDVQSGAGAVEKENDRPLPWYSLGKDRRSIVEPTRDLKEVMAALGTEMQGTQGEVKIRVRANKSLPVETINGVTLDLQDLEARLNRGREPGQGRLTFVMLGEVSEPEKS